MLVELLIISLQEAHSVDGAFMMALIGLRRANAVKIATKLPSSGRTMVPNDAMTMPEGAESSSCSKVRSGKLGIIYKCLHGMEITTNFDISSLQLSGLTWRRFAGRAFGGPAMIGPTSFAWGGMDMGTADSRLCAWNKTSDEDLSVEREKYKNQPNDVA